MSAWLAHHRHAFAMGLKRLAGSPLSTLLNVAVIGIAFSLPAGVYVMLDNLRVLSGHIDSAPQLSLFLTLDAGKQDIAEIEARLRRHPAVARFEFVPRERALQQLKRSAGLTEVVDSLKQNPLPDAFVVNAKDTAPQTLESLRSEMLKWPKAEHVQLDSAWAKRLGAMLKLARLAVLILATLLAFALIAVTFNTIRLQILTQRDEIEVVKLIGATNGFICRPFLYFGALQGLAGGAAAWGIVALAIELLNGNLGELAQLYNISFRLAHLAPEDGLSLLAFSAWLGWAGAWLSVARHLWQIEPQ